MKALFSYLALSGILIGAAITIAGQTGPNKQGGQRKERTQVLIVDKRNGGRGGNGNSESRRSRQGAQIGQLIRSEHRR